MTQSGENSGGASVCLRFNFPAMVNLSIFEDAEQASVELAIPHREIKDLQSALDRNSFLVRPVRSCESIKDVRDGHHPGLQWNLRRAELVRIPGAVQLFMMSAGYLGNIAKFVRPRDC